MQYDLPPSLPKPDANSASHSERVAAFIRERIADAGGDISFAQYMQHALYAPGLGYYSAGATKFGEQGDFVTAPEVSAVFGRIVARQCAEVLAEINGGEVLASPHCPERRVSGQLSCWRLCQVLRHLPARGRPQVH